MAVSPKDINSITVKDVNAVIREIDCKLLTSPNTYLNRQEDCYSVRVNHEAIKNPLVQLAICAAYENAGWESCNVKSESTYDRDSPSSPDAYFVLLVK